MTTTIAQLQDEKSELLKKVNVLIAEKKSKYSNMDIESPMSDDEKDLSQRINCIFSEIGLIVRQLRKMK